MIQKSNHDAQTERKMPADGDTSFKNRKNPTKVNDSQVDMHTLEKNIVSKVRSEVNSVMTTVETRVQDAVLTAIENLLIPRVEVAMKSINAS